MGRSRRMARRRSRRWRRRRRGRWKARRRSSNRRRGRRSVGGGGDGGGGEVGLQEEVFVSAMGESRWTWQCEVDVERVALFQL